MTNRQGERMRKVFMLVAALALPISVLSVVLTSAPASASSGPKGKITCTTMSGSTGSGTIVISGCSGTAVPGTGGSSKPLSIAVLAAGGPVTWVNNDVTVFAAPALSSASAKHCPGYVKPPKGGPTPAEPTLEKFSGAVNSDNTGMKVPGKYKGEVCISQSGSFSAPKALKVS
ncbi:MAG: hypothetical protein P4L20_00020 [Acidimicrobiales bacterium]|nr:hypothetical protein [Acidimicrobiales bacterium]